MIKKVRSALYYAIGSDIYGFHDIMRDLHSETGELAWKLGASDRPLNRVPTL